MTKRTAEATVNTVTQVSGDVQALLITLQQTLVTLGELLKQTPPPAQPVPSSEGQQ